MKDEGIQKLLNLIDFQIEKMEDLLKRIKAFEASLDPEEDEEEEEFYAGN